MARVVVLIDGFNVYHVLQREPAYHRYKWLNYAALARGYIRGQDTLERTYLFTTLATWDQSKVGRHEATCTSFGDRALPSCSASSSGGTGCVRSVTGSTRLPRRS